MWAVDAPEPGEKVRELLNADEVPGPEDAISLVRAMAGEDAVHCLGAAPRPCCLRMALFACGA
jgi:hypothetical protein